VNLLVLVVDDEPDVEVLFRQQFRHDLRAGRYTMEFARSGDQALQRIADAEGISIILIRACPLRQQKFVDACPRRASRKSARGFREAMLVLRMLSG
jgi:CheY-like chemotaxis protein